MYSNEDIQLTEGLLLSQGLIGFSDFGVINSELAEPLLEKGLLALEVLPAAVPRARPWICAHITRQGTKALKAARKVFREEYNSSLPLLSENELYAKDETTDSSKLIFTKEFLLSEIYAGRVEKIDRHYTELVEWEES